MRLERLYWFLAAGGLLLGACTPDEAGPASAELAAYCDVASRPDLQGWIGDVVTLCEPRPAAADSEPMGPCEAHRFAGSGLQPLELALDTDARLVQAAGDRWVVLTSDERLLLGPAGGPFQTLAPWAAEPRVSEDGDAVAYVALADGFEEPGLGVPTVLVTHDLAADRRQVVTEDPQASTPFPIPGSDEVLYVSTTSGAASLWRGAPGREPEQITNEGMDRPAQGFVPVPSRQLAWIGAGEVVFGAHHEDSRLWHVSLSTGGASELGPGAWPRVNADGSVTARARTGEDCAVTYLQGRMP